MSRWHWPWIAGGLYACLLLALALTLHPVQIAHAETDGFVLHVDALLHGKLTFDGYHPLTTVLAGTTVAWLLGTDAFTSLRLVSALAGGLLLVATWNLGRSLAPGSRPWLAAATVGTHAVVLLNCLQAASDGLGAALVVTTAWLAVRTWHTGSQRLALLTGCAFGLAFGTRAATIGFGPLLLLPLWRPGGLRLLPALLSGAILGFLPHGLVAWSLRGSPFSTDNWRNVALKLGGFEPALLERPGYASFAELWAARAGDVLRLAAADVRDLLTVGLGRGLVRDVPRWLALALSTLAILSLVRLARAHRAGFALAAAIGGYLLLLCLTFDPMERLLLPVLALLPAVAGIGSLRASWPWSLVTLGLVATTFVGNLWFLPARLREFVALHPHAEIATVQDLAGDRSIVRVASSLAPMTCYAPVPVSYLVPPRPDVYADPVATVTHVLRSCRDVGADVAVIGRCSNAPMYRVMRTAPLPADVRRELRGGEVVVLRLPTAIVAADASASWIESFVAAPAQWRDGSLAVALRMPAAAAHARVVRASATVDGQATPPMPFDLEPAGDGVWRADLRFRPPPGTWTLHGRLQLDDGTIVHAPPRTVVVPATGAPQPRQGN